MPSILRRTDALMASLQDVARNLAVASPKFGQLTNNVVDTTDTLPATLMQAQDGGLRARASAGPAPPQLAARRQGGATAQPARACERGRGRERAAVLGAAALPSSWPAARQSAGGGAAARPAYGADQPGRSPRAGNEPAAVAIRQYRPALDPRL